MENSDNGEQPKISMQIVPSTASASNSNSIMEERYLTLEDFDIPSNLEGEGDDNDNTYEYVYEGGEPSNSVKNLMMSLKGKEMRQPTIDNYFTPYSVTTDYEFENTLLKIEIKELKEKMMELEMLVLNMKTSNGCVEGEATTTSNSITSPFPFFYDRIMTKIKNIEEEMGNMKLNFESFEATQSNHEDRIDMIEETLLNNDDEDEDGDDDETVNNYENFENSEDFL